MAQRLHVPSRSAAREEEHGWIRPLPLPYLLWRAAVAAAVELVETREETGSNIIKIKGILCV